MDLIQSLKISKSGLSAQRTKMNVIAENLANVDTTKTEEGGPYKRNIVVFESEPLKNFRNTLRRMGKEYTTVKIGEVTKSQEQFRMVYNPNHPDADSDTGYVAMPNINSLTEIADMVVARRAYDANITAISTAKSMILKALEIGR